MNKDNYSVQAEHLVGRSEVRVDAFDKVTGRTKYYEDRMPGDALYLRKEYRYLLCGENTRRRKGAHLLRRAGYTLSHRRPSLEHGPGASGR